MSEAVVFAPCWTLPKQWAAGASWSLLRRAGATDLLMVFVQHALEAALGGEGPCRARVAGSQTLRETWRMPDHKARPLGHQPGVVFPRQRLFTGTYQRRESAHEYARPVLGHPG